MLYCTCMEALVIRDTHKLIASLQKRGFTAQQAEGITEAIKEIDASALATKADLRELKIDLIKWLSGILIAHGLGTAALTVALLQLLA
jgi:hypothetical protein